MPLKLWHRLRSWLAAPAVVPAERLDLPPTVLSRRAFLGGMAATVAAPAIVRFDSIMPVRAVANDLLKNGRLLSSEELVAELQDVVRRVFVPRVYVQLWQRSPLMQQMMRNTDYVNGVWVEGG